MQTSIRIAFMAMALALASPGVPAAQSDAAVIREPPKKPGGGSGTTFKQGNGAFGGTAKPPPEPKEDKAMKKPWGKDPKEAIVNPCNDDRPPSWCK